MKKLTAVEAMQALLDGKKVRKPNWLKDEYLKIKNGIIVDENEKEGSFGILANREYEIYPYPNSQESINEKLQLELAEAREEIFKLKKLIKCMREEKENYEVCIHAWKVHSSNLTGDIIQLKNKHYENKISENMFLKPERFTL